MPLSLTYTEGASAALSMNRFSSTLNFKDLLAKALSRSNFARSSSFYDCLIYPVGVSK
jgi:hypothetical protein